MSVLINLGGLVLMALIVWWFWIAQSRTTRKAAGDDVIDIVVDDGVYEPAVIETDAGKTLRLRFERRDASPCAERVVFQDLGVSETLPIGEKTTLTLHPEHPGTYGFTCQMQMYRGKLIVH